MILKRKYEVEVYCDNCAYTSTIRIPKGTFVYDFLRSKGCVCDNCGCRVRELVDDRLNPLKLEQRHKQELAEIRRKIELKSGGER